MSPAMIEFVSLPFSQRFYCYSSCPTSDDVFSVPQIVLSKKLGLRALHWHGPSHYQPVTIVVRELQILVTFVEPITYVLNIPPLVL